MASWERRKHERRILRRHRTPSDVKVLQIIDSLGMGGAETWLMEVLRLWSADALRNPKVDFLMTSGRTAIFDEEARQLGAELFYLPFQKGSLHGFAGEFRRILRTGRYEAIHDHSDYASGWHFLLGAGHLPPVRITHVHNPAYQIRSNYGTIVRRRLTARLGRECTRHFATHIAGTSRQVLSEYGFNSPAFRRRAKGALHCGIQTERFLGDPVRAKQQLCAEFRWPQNSKIILFAGRIDRSADPADPQAHKNAPFAVKVGLACAARDPGVRMLLAGELSRAVPELREQVEAAGCQGRIVFGGLRRDIEYLMLASDTLLFPSRGEGLGMVSVEAQAAGLPVIASSRVPRECEVIPELVHFLDMDAGIASWASAALRVMERGRMENASCNRRVAESSFSIIVSSQALVKLYCEGQLPSQA